MKAFLSYSTKNKHIAGKIHDEFKKVGIEVFVAHRSIKPSKEWRSEIKRELAESKWFFAVITGAFRKSLWTDQELGMAIALKRDIFLFCAGKHKAYGFAADYQAMRFKSTDIGRLAGDFMMAISDEKSGQYLKRQIIGQLFKSSSYTESRDLLRHLRAFHLSSSEKRRVLLAAKKNNQVGGGSRGRNGWGFNDVRDYLYGLELELNSH